MHLDNINFLTLRALADIHLTCQVEELLFFHDSAKFVTIIWILAKTVDRSKLVLAQQDQLFVFGREKYVSRFLLLQACVSVCEDITFL